MLTAQASTDHATCEAAEAAAGGELGAGDGGWSGGECGRPLWGEADDCTIDRVEISELTVQVATCHCLFTTVHRLSLCAQEGPLACRTAEIPAEELDALRTERREQQELCQPPPLRAGGKTLSFHCLARAIRCLSPPFSAVLLAPQVWLDGVLSNVQASTQPRAGYHPVSEHVSLCVLHCLSLPFSALKR